MIPKPRIVVDTNIVASAIFFGGTTTRLALQAATSRGVVLASEATLLDLFSLLNRPRLARLYSAAKYQAPAQEYASRCQIVAIHSTIRICRDPLDDKFLELAQDGRADLILTADKDLLTLHPFRGIPILSPAQYIE